MLVKDHFSQVKIPQEAQIVFVSDMYVDDYVGGAELTTQSLIDSCPLPYAKLHSKDVNMQTLQEGYHCHWIFGNFSGLDFNLIPTIVGNMKYSILEYDYKYCRFRSPEKHQNIQGTPCDCHNQPVGKIISAFFQGAQALWWMSEAQKERYLTFFPFLSDKDNIVLSSVFDHKTLGKMKLLRDQSSGAARKNWIVLGSDSWVKGAESAKAWCEQQGKEYEVVWNVSYDEMLSKLASSEGFVYLPAGADTCPRMVIEAKLLGCKLHLNDYVQHAKEEWFDTDDVESIHDYLYSATDLFWNSIKNILNYTPKISGYTTTYNCIAQEYPFESSIRSMLNFCDEVCVVDGGSTDGTLYKLYQLAKEFAEPGELTEEFINDVESEIPESSSKIRSITTKKLKVKRVDRDWTHPRHAVFDGMQKAEARVMCTGDFCWQMDSDEVVDESDATKVADLCKKLPQNIEVVSLPVIEYWGGLDKVRLDIQPWKWRLSKNSPNITHGIPAELRRIDSEGNLYALEGTDGCDMIYVDSGERVPHVTFHNQESEMLRRQAMAGDPNALQAYQDWFNQVIDNLPGVHHYSWYNISRKIRTYKNYWTKHWNSLYNKSVEDTADTNMMFDLPWSQIADDMIEKRAQELKEKTGGWIWHQKWDGRITPHIKVTSPLLLKS